MKYYGLIMPSVFPTGVFIQDIKQTASSDESEGINTMMVTLTNQQKAHFNVKNGKQGSSAEATAQMEQHAKDYIAAELTDQKAALEQAIETGKTDINNSAEQANTDLQQKVTQAEAELSALIQSVEQALQGKVNEAKTYIDGQLSAASQGLQEDINTKFIEYYKNGYIQMPGMPSPLEDASLHFEGYSWHEVNYDGNFFRAKGRNAKAFSSKKLTKEQIRNGDYIFQDDEQGDAIRNILGELGRKAAHSFAAWSNDEVKGGALSSDNHFTTWPTGQGYSSIYYKNIKFNASKADGVKVAEENRSRNLTFTFWVLVKNE